MAAPSLEHLKGRDIAGFRILAELGRGNNGIVYLARQLTLDREVALKLLLPELAAEIAADWELPTEAVQSGLETLRSHLELVQSDAALLYEMT